MAEENTGKIAIILAALGGLGTALYFILKKKVPEVVPPVEGKVTAKIISVGVNGG